MNVDRWIAGSASVVAACAFTLSIYEGCATREHNRRSVAPILILDSKKNEEGSGFGIKNSGLGPALVQWFEVTVDGAWIQTWEGFVKELKLSGSSGYDYANLGPQTVILPGEDWRVFWARTGTMDSSLREVRRRIIMRACYCSMYDECWQTITSTTTEQHPAREKCGEPPLLPFLGNKKPNEKPL